jgi:hypothetical protein
MIDCAVFHARVEPRIAELLAIATVEPTVTDIRDLVPVTVVMPGALAIDYDEGPLIAETDTLRQPVGFLPAGQVSQSADRPYNFSGFLTINSGHDLHLNRTVDQYANKTLCGHLSSYLDEIKKHIKKLDFRQLMIKNPQ